MDSAFNSVQLRTDATPDQLLKQLALSPLIYIRLAGMLFAVIVFGCVADKGYFSEDTCYFNDSGACSFALAIGVLAFIICLAFLVKDVMFVIVDFSSNLLFKKALVIVDITVTGLWTFFWFVAFCFTADQLRSNTIKVEHSPVKNCLNSVVAFSFFSVLLWISIIVLNALFFFWIIKGTDRDCRPTNYSNFPEGDDDDFDSKVPEPSSETPSSQYTPPEY